jgi:hypothetical protein
MVIAAPSRGTRIVTRSPKPNADIERLALNGRLISTFERPASGGFTGMAAQAFNEGVDRSGSAFFLSGGSIIFTIVADRRAPRTVRADFGAITETLLRDTECDHLFSGRGAFPIRDALWMRVQDFQSNRLIAVELPRGQLSRPHVGMSRWQYPGYRR